MEAGRGKREYGCYAIVYISPTLLGLRAPPSHPFRPPTDVHARGNLTGKAALFSSTEKGFVFTMGHGRIVRSEVTVILTVGVGLIRKQNGHEIKDFINQIEVAYQELNGL